MIIQITNKALERYGDPAGSPSLAVTLREEEHHMPKVDKGRLDGVEGMSKYSALELYALADEYVARIAAPNNTDDTKWLKRRADRLRKLAIQKEKALIHKSSIKVKHHQSR